MFDHFMNIDISSQTKYLPSAESQGGLENPGDHLHNASHDKQQNISSVHHAKKLN